MHSFCRRTCAPTDIIKPAANALCSTYARTLKIAPLNRMPKKRCNRADCHSDNLNKSNQGRKNRIDCGDEHRAQASAEQINLCFQNAHLVCRRIQCAAHIGLRICCLLHDSNIAQLCLIRLRQTVNAFIDSQIVQFLLQSGIGNINAQPADRFKLTGNGSLQFLERIFCTQIEEGSHIIAKLCEVLAKNVGFIGCHAKAGCKVLENSHIPHSFTAVNAKHVFHLLRKSAAAVSRIAHCHSKQVNIFCVLAVVGYGTFQKCVSLLNNCYHNGL